MPQRHFERADNHAPTLTRRGKLNTDSTKLHTIGEEERSWATAGPPLSGLPHQFVAVKKSNKDANFDELSAVPPISSCDRRSGGRHLEKIGWIQSTVPRPGAAFIRRPIDGDRNTKRLRTAVQKTSGGDTMKVKTLACNFAAAALAGALLFTTPSPSRADVTIKFGWITTDSETDSYRFAAHAFADALEAAKPGFFKIRFFPNRQLGDERDMMQGMRLGTVDAALITNSTVANVENAFTISDLPFLYPRSEVAYKVLDSALGDSLFKKLAAKQVIGLAWCDAGFRNMINGKRPITKYEDVHGLKFRVIESPLFVRMFDLLGGAGVPMPFGEVYTALQQGTIDGIENPTWSIAANRIDEVIKYFSITRHIYSATPILMSAKVFNGLSDGDKAIVRAAAKTACEKQRVFNAQSEAKIIEEMKGRGVKINEVTDMAPFQARVKPIYDEYRSKLGAEFYDEWVKGVKSASGGK
jgi:tripartite ATP-independent transporter DctP family solute receptor